MAGLFYCLENSLTDHDGNEDRIKVMPLCPECQTPPEIFPWRGDGYGDGDIECWFIGCPKPYPHKYYARANHGAKKDAIDTWHRIVND